MPSQCVQEVAITHIRNGKILLLKLQSIQSEMSLYLCIWD